MIKYLHFNNFNGCFKYFFSLSRKGSVWLFVTLVFLCSANNLSAQVIVETFESIATPITSTSTPTVAGTSTSTSTTSCTFAATTTSYPAGSNTWTHAIAASSSTLSIGITNSLYTSSSTSSTTNGAVSCYTTFSTLSSTSSAPSSESTYGPDSTGTFSWYFAGPVSISATTSGYHSSYASLVMPNNSFLISPTVSGGIAEVTFG